MNTQYAIYMILFGAFVMLASLIKYSRLLKFPLNLKNSKHKGISNIIKYNYIMMHIFFIGYVATATLLYQKHHLTDFLVAVIFLCGALFVFSVIYIQIEISEVVNEIYSFHTVESLVSTIEAKDKYTRGHSKHVAALAVCFHEHLPKSFKKGINPHMLKYAGLLHDIGKIGISDTILNKEGPLTEDEWHQMKEHPRIGYEIIKENVIINSVSDWVYYHHERIDGKGYYGLKGHEIPFEAKLLCLVDCYSAITTDRSYRKGKSHKEAIEIMEMVKGTQLDSELVAIFKVIPEQKLIACLPEEIKL